MLIPHPPLTPRLRGRGKIGPTIASIGPMQVDRHRLRAPAINECEVMIRHLAEENQLQSSEVSFPHTGSQRLLLSSADSQLLQEYYNTIWKPDN